jgi:peptide/nickel transport system substrate-binding protein
MKATSKVLAALLAVLMVLSLAGCNGKKEPENTTPLVVGYAPFNSKFSPFFSETAYDQDVWALTSIGLLSSDRTGAIVYNGIKGETIAYNGHDYTYYGPADLKVTQNADGTVDYDFTLRDDLVFSDGEKLSVDDVIFSMYVLCDPTYDGSSTLFAQPIEGMEAYRSGMETIYNILAAAGAEGTSEFVDADTTKAFWDHIQNEAGPAFAQSIVDYVIANYGAAYGVSQVWDSAALWGFELPEGATAKDFWDAIYAAYEGDIVTASDKEAASSALTSFVDDKYKSAVKTGDSAPSITGIQKTGDNSLRIHMTKFDAVSVYQLGVTIAPLHYYGETAKYDYANNKFGFDKGDLSHVRSVTSKPLGAGPYKFIKFENGVVNFEANEKYYQGAPKTKYLNYIETSEADKLNGVVTGTIDVTDPSISGDTVKAIQAANSNGELSGDKITTNLVDNLGYGYIGISANRVNVGGDGASDASKALRKAFATLYAVNRDVAIDSYYGERAVVINYPISNTSWAAPQPTDADYKVAFSVDAQGNDIYTSGMDRDAQIAAAKAAALGYFEAAGYTVADGKVTAAPEGAKMEYEFWIPADGVGDHPSFMVCNLAKEQLADLGINLIIRDLSNSSELWTSLEAEGVDMWAAAWGATVDPDMYQIYYSGSTGLTPGGSNYMYDIADPQLDQLIMDARSSADQAYRKAMYKACLDIIVDWAVEVPVYQRKNGIIFSTERVNMATVTPDITTFYGWMGDIQGTELNK